MLKAILLCYILIYFSFPVANGDLLCYSCVMNGGEADDSCVKNPAAVVTSNPTVQCPTKYCTIVRTEYSNSPGQIYTFYRGCATVDDSGDSDAGGFKQYTRICTTKLCNDWDGIASGPGGGSGGSGGGGSGGSGSGGSGGSGNGNDDGPWIILGVGGAAKQRVDLYITFITFSVVMILYR